MNGSGSVEMDIVIGIIGYLLDVGFFCKWILDELNVYWINGKWIIRSLENWIIGLMVNWICKWVWKMVNGLWLIMDSNG